jgi:hypothetical protein
LGLPLPGTSEVLFLFPGEVLDDVLALHGGGAIGEFLNINQLDGAMSAGVAGTSAVVMLLEAALRIGGPTGVVGTVGTLEEVAEEGHSYP